MCFSLAVSIDHSDIDPQRAFYDHANLLTGDNGSISFWDWKSGHRFQSLDTTAQPGSLDAETGLMSSTYDQTGMRLICGEADKTSKFPLHCAVSLFNVFAHKNLL